MFSYGGYFFMKQINANNFYSYLVGNITNHKIKISILAFLTDMWHKYKYNKFLLKDVVYDYSNNKVHPSFLKSSVPDDYIIAYTLESYDIVNSIKKIENISIKTDLIEKMILEKKPQNQEEAYKLFIDELVLLLLMGALGNNGRRQKFVD